MKQYIIRQEIGFLRNGDLFFEEARQGCFSKGRRNFPMMEIEALTFRTMEAAGLRKHIEPGKVFEIKEIKGE